MALPSFDHWLAFTLATALFVASPGAMFALVVGTSLSSGFAKALATACGATVGNLALWLATLAGAAAVLLASPVLFAVLRAVGAVYLAWLGIGFWRSSLRPGSLAADNRLPVRKSAGRAFAEGVGTAVSNPKDLVFMVAFVPPFLDPGRSIIGQGMVLWATQSLLVWVIMGAYAAAAGALRGGGADRPWVVRLSQRAIGSILIVLGVVLGLGRL